MPYQTPDASAFTKIKKDTVSSAAELAISQVKRRTVVPYTFYSATYKIKYEPALVPPKPIPTFVLINKNTYQTILTGGNLPFYNGGSVTLSTTGALGNRWYAGYMFDGTTSEDGFAFNTGGSPSITVSFPVSVYVTKIFMIGRGSGSGIPPAATLTIDNVASGTTAKGIVYNELGLVSPVFTGEGIYIQPNKVGRVWKLTFASQAFYQVIDELEFQGYAV